MLKKIVDGETILYLGGQGREPIEGFFNADTMNLIIGNNGTGKTRLLRSLSRMISTQNQFLPGTAVFDDEDKSSVYGAIYFTPVPFKVDLPRRSNFFRNASVRYSNGRIPDVDIEHFKLVASKFDIKTRPIARACGNLSDFAKVCVDALWIEKIYLKVETGFSDLDSAIEALFRDRELHESTLKRNSAEADGEEDFDANGALDQHVFLGKKSKQNLKDLIELYTSQVLQSDCISLLTGFSEAYRKTKNIANGKSRLVFAFLERFCDWRFEIPIVLNSRIESALSEVVPISDVIRVMQANASRFGAVRNNTSKIFEFEIWSDEIFDSLRGKDFSSIFDIFWENFSSGQLALITQFSEIDKAAIELRISGVNSLILLIDEGDLFLHVGWQRQYLNAINDFAAELKRKFKLVQIILTTHSPIMLTDFPSDCVLKLDRDVDRAKDTFAASMQHVFNSSLDSMSIGEFAAVKLREAVALLKEGVSNEFTEYVVSITGDPILRRELIKLRDLRLKVDV